MKYLIKLESQLHTTVQKYMKAFPIIFYNSLKKKSRIKDFYLVKISKKITPVGHFLWPYEQAVGNYIKTKGVGHLTLTTG